MIEYWPTNTVSCMQLPNFEKFQNPKTRKWITDLKLDVDANPLQIAPDDLFVAKFHSFFEVLKEGSYKFYILLGSSDMAMVKIDETYMAKISCSIDPTPVTFEALIPMGKSLTFSGDFLRVDKHILFISNV